MSISQKEGKKEKVKRLFCSKKKLNRLNHQMLSVLKKKKKKKKIHPA